MRGETWFMILPLFHSIISIHSPHARGDIFYPPLIYSDTISIHSPHARGDQNSTVSCGITSTFQSTPLMRGETKGEPFTAHNILFQSTPLMRGETPAECCLELVFKFQSTPLMRGETRCSHFMISVNFISIHSPHARGDRFFAEMGESSKNFNPLPSCEGRRNSYARLCT